MPMLAPLALLAVASVLLLAAGVVTGLTAPFDAAVADVLRDDGLRAPLGFLRVVTEAGATWAATLVAVVIGGVMVVLRRALTGAVAALALLLTSIGNTLVKSVVARTRPEVVEPLLDARGYAFPSGHTIMATVAWGIVGVLVWRSALPRWLRLSGAIGLTALIVLVGVSRVYLGAHHATDVLAGWAAGAVILLLVARLTRGADHWDPARRASRDRGSENTSGT